MTKLISIISLISISINVFNQQFLHLNKSGQIDGLKNAHISFGDFDGDGDLDLLCMGRDNAFEEASMIYENKIDEGFWYEKRTDLLLPGLSYGWSDWGDYDNDGDKDILLAGEDKNSNFHTMVYENKIGTGEGFVKNDSIIMPGIKDCVVEWVDKDFDGDMDIFISGYDSDYKYRVETYQNNLETDSSFTLSWNATDASGRGCLADFDGDDDMDFFYTYYYSGYYYLLTYENRLADSGKFAYREDLYLPGTINGKIDWGDYDNDGDMDVVITGNSTDYFVEVYENKVYDGQGFVRDSSGFDKLTNGYAVWDDYDNDNDLDLFINGETQSSNWVTKIYKNDGAPGTRFTYESSINLTNIEYGFGTWFDFDGDTSTDLILTGGQPGSFQSSTQIFKNLTSSENGFIEVNGYPSLPLKDANIAFGDFDNDNDLDLFVSGDEGSRTSILYENRLNEDLYFAETEHDFIDVWEGKAKWCDFDNDNDLDIFICGDLAYGNPDSKLYENKVNTGEGFVEYTEITFKKLSSSSVDWGDYDNDGDYDLLVSGQDNSYNSHTLVYKNSVNESNKFEETNYNLWAMDDGEAKFADFDNDGWLDIIVAGYDRTYIYKNNINSYTQLTDLSLPGLRRVSMDIGDVDQDGDIDFVLTGFDFNLQTTHSYIYENKLNTDEGFSNMAAVILPEIKDAAVQFGDIDNDGDLDLVACGEHKNDYKSMVFENELDIGGGFTELTSESIEGVYRSDINLGDFDNDNDLDIIVTGTTMSDEGFLGIYKNTASTINEKPYSPNNLSYQLTNNLIVLSWNKASDTETKASALSYNLKVGTKPDSTDILSPNTNDNYRLISGIGNQQTDTFAIVSKLNYGTYYWGIQTIDNAFTESNFSTNTELLVEPKADFIINNKSICHDDTLTIEFTGYFYDSSLVDFQWDLDSGIIVSGDSIGSFKVVWNTTGEKHLSLIVSESGHTSLVKLDTIQIYPSPGVELGDDITACDGKIIKITSETEGSNLSYLWSTNDTTAHINTGIEGLYTLQVTNEHNCKSIDSIRLELIQPYSEAKICVVTVDSLENVIAWERSYNEGIASYNIYKETNVADEYKLAGNVPIENLSVFVDENAQPGIRSERYKISVVDTCGNESDLSNAHKTMHLTINLGVENAFNLIWEHYEGIDFNSYIIYRGTSNENLEPIDTVPNNITTYTDSPEQDGEYYYQIAVVLPGVCTPTSRKKASSGPFSQAHSNMEKKLKGTNNLTLHNDIEKRVTIYPNPLENHKLHIKTNSIHYYLLNILDINGKTIYQSDKYKETSIVYTGNFYNGVYIVQLYTPQGVIRKKLIVNKTE